MHPSLKKPGSVVIKLGTGVLTSGIGKLDTSCLSNICAQVANLRAQGIEVILVSSGAIGLGMGRLGLTVRPTDLATLQGCAAVGQSILIQTWQEHFQPHGVTVGQVLLTRDDLRGRTRHLAAKNTFARLKRLGVVPIVNENDTVSAEEIRFGDNDVLSAMVASLTAADFLFLLSTIPGLADRRGDGSTVPVVPKITPEIMAMAEGTDSTTSVGGMITKLEAARIAVRSGCGVFIAAGARPAVVEDLLAGRGEGTFFVPNGIPLEAKKRWIAFFDRPKGNLFLDPGACEAVRGNGKSLLARGILRTDGSFQEGDLVALCDPAGVTFARGIVRFSSEEIHRIGRRSNDEIRALFPGRKRLEIVHRNEMVLLD